MNRAKAETIADRIMTRIETDKAIHKDAIADEIQAGDALDEIVDIISHDGEKWVHRDGTPFDTDADKRPAPVACVGRYIVFGAAATALDLDDRDTA